MRGGGASARARSTRSVARRTGRTGRFGRRDDADRKAGAARGQLPNRRRPGRCGIRKVRRRVRTEIVEVDPAIVRVDVEAVAAEEADEGDPETLGGVNGEARWGRYGADDRH